MREMKKIDYWVERLQLKPHPEGGYYKEIYRCPDRIHFDAMKDYRSVSTAIYYLIEKDSFSSFHRLKSDELWHFYAGHAVTVHMISPEGKYSNFTVGSDIENEQEFNGIIKAGNWFAAETLGDYSLVGCTVSPGFDFNDFELAVRDKFLNLFPQHAEIIDRFTR